jgi:recombination protein RecT
MAGTQTKPAAAPVQPATRTAVAVREPHGITALLSSDAARKRIAPLLPPGVTMEAIQSEVFFAAQLNPEILECAPASILRAVARGVQLDLVFGEDLHLVPFNTKVSKRGEPDRYAKLCTLIVGYKGLAKLVVRSGAARAVESAAVYANDHFEYELGLDAKLRHIPVEDPAKRGALRGAYCIIRRGHGLSTFEFLPLAKIEARRALSKKWGPKTYPECPDWYAEKSAIRSTTDLLPKSRKLQVVLQHVDAAETEEVPAGEFEIVDAAPAPADPTAPPAHSEDDDAWPGQLTGEDEEA